MRWPWQSKALSINQVIDRLEAINQSKSGVSVTAENCMRSPTVQAIVTAVSRRIAVSPVRVLQKTQADGRTNKKDLPKHSVAILLNRPNNWQTKVDFWHDLTSQLIRYGNCYAFKSRGSTGPIRRLIPLDAGVTRGKLSDTNDLTFTTTTNAGSVARDYKPEQLFHARGPARDFINGDSPVTDIKETIGLEIAAEEFGSTFFGNGAIPLLVFQMMQGFKDFKSLEERDEFLQAVRDRLGGTQKHKAFLLPKGIELADLNKTSVENDKAQFIETRKYQRTVIAGAFGVPPHLVGDLERATFNNVEQQDSDFTINVILPHVRTLEAALERDLLTDTDRKAGIVIRFNLDAIQRADFKSRQQGLQIQRLNGVISANEWRERENLNPIDDDKGGSDYWMPANYQLPGEDPDEGKENDDDPTDNSPVDDKEPKQTAD